MSIPTADYAHLLREAIQQAKANSPRAVDDLVRCASEAAKAVDDVTHRAAVLELVPINQDEGASAAYQLVLRRVGSEAPPADLGVYAVSAAGYPIQRWYSRIGWESNVEPNGRYLGVSQLEDHFKWMVSKPDSRLVVLVTFVQEQTSSGNRAGPVPG